MKFTIKKDDIIDVLSKIQGITGRKSNLAITEYVLIKSSDSGISIAATDLETGFEGYYPSVIEKEGKIAINSHKLFEIVKNFPSEEIYISEDEKRWFKIGNNIVEYNIVGMNPDDFPDIPHAEQVEFFTINAVDFKKMIEKTIMITATGDEKRAHIVGVNFECKTEKNISIVRMVSTDGKRLSKVDYIHKEKLPEIKVLIPKKGLNEVNKFLETEDQVKIGIKDNHFIIKKENETIIINLLEGEFPEYNDIINAKYNSKIEINKNSFKMMLKRMSILTSEDYKGVIFNFNKDKLLVTAANPDIGESKEEMKIDYKNEKTEIAFNPQFFLDTLNFVDSEKVLLNINNNESPCLIRSENDNNFISIIMPMKI